MKITVEGQIFPKVWDIASNVKKIGNRRKGWNLGSGTMSYPVYEVTLPEDTKKEGIYFITPQGVKLYFSQGSQYEIGYLISDLDSGSLACKYFQEN